MITEFQIFFSFEVETRVFDPIKCKAESVSDLSVRKNVNRNLKM